MSFGPVSDGPSRPAPYDFERGERGSGQLCQFFVKSGWCKWGEGCRHAHIPGPDTPPKSGEVCQFFAKSGWCRYGDTCRLGKMGISTILEYMNIYDTYLYIIWFHMVS